MKKVVEVADVSKIFTDFWGRPKVKAVQSINLEINQGEIFGLLGPNGSGKSTTIKMLLGLLKPTNGQIAVFGQRPRSAEIKNKIGFLPEESYLYPFLTAEETLHFFGGLFGLSKGVRAERINELIKMVGLEHARNRILGEFSKGMARRIGLAQALIGDPQFLILDEPTSGLDPIGILEIKELILSLKKKGKTILLSSHLLSEVQDVCDRVCILFGGKVCSYGSLDELLVQKNKINFEISNIEKSQINSIKTWLSNQNLTFTAQPSRENLENYFMRVISLEENTVTGGSKKGSGVPTFLNNENSLDSLLPKTEEKKAEESKVVNQVLEELVKKPEESPKENNSSDLNQKLLDELTQNKSDKPLSDK